MHAILARLVSLAQRPFWGESKTLRSHLLSPPARAPTSVSRIWSNRVRADVLTFLSDLIYRHSEFQYISVATLRPRRGLRRMILPKRLTVRLVRIRHQCPADTTTIALIDDTVRCHASRSRKAFVLKVFGVRPVSALNARLKGESEP